MSTHTQAKALYDDLNGAAGAVPWSIGKVVNALLEQAKTEQPDHVSLAVMDPLEEAGNGYVASTNTVAVRALVGQIVEATKPPRTVHVA